MGNTISVTEIKVFPFEECLSLGHLRGIATVVINGAVRIRGIRILEDVGGLFIGFPADPFYKGEDSRYVVECVTEDAKKVIKDAVLEQYRAAIG